MEWIQGFFIGSMLWPWLLVLAEVAVLFSCIRSESGLAATISVVVAALLFKVLFNISVLQYVLENWYLVLMYLVLYGVIAAGYAALRLDRVGAEWRRKFDDEPNVERQKRLYEERPLASNHKKDIIFWMTYWPISASLWLASDLFREIFVSIYHRLLTVFDRILSRHMNGITFLEKPPAE